MIMCLLRDCRLCFLFVKKNYGPPKSQNFDFSVVFDTLTFLDNYLPKSEFLDSIEITNCVDLFCKKSFDSWKGQTFDLVTVLQTFLYITSHKSDIIALIKTTDC